MDDAQLLLAQSATYTMGLPNLKAESQNIAAPGSPPDYTSSAAALYGTSLTPATLVTQTASAASVSAVKYEVNSITSLPTPLSTVNVTGSYNTTNTPPLLAAANQTHSVWLGGAAQQTGSNTVAVGTGAGAVGNNCTIVSTAAGQTYPVSTQNLTILCATTPVVAAPVSASNTTMLSGTPASGQDLTVVGYLSLPYTGADNSSSTVVGPNAMETGSSGTRNVAVGAAAASATVANNIVAVGSGGNSQNVQDGCVALVSGSPTLMAGSVTIGGNNVQSGGIMIGVDGNMVSGRAIGNSNVVTGGGFVSMLGAGLVQSTPPASTMVIGSTATPMFVPTQSDPSQQPLYVTQSLECYINGVPVWIPLSPTLAP